MRKLYLFNNTQGNSGMDSCYSMTDKGIVLGNHLCSHSGFMQLDLHDHPKRQEDIKNHFGDEPYELIIVPDGEVRTHAGLTEAFKLNQIEAEKNKA